MGTTLSMFSVSEIKGIYLFSFDFMFCGLFKKKFKKGQKFKNVKAV